jgi:hypothetical protein
MPRFELIQDGVVVASAEVSQDVYDYLQAHPDEARRIADEVVARAAEKAFIEVFGLPTE